MAAPSAEQAPKWRGLALPRLRESPVNGFDLLQRRTYVTRRRCNPLPAIQLGYMRTTQGSLRFDDMRKRLGDRATRTLSIIAEGCDEWKVRGQASPLRQLGGRILHLD